MLDRHQESNPPRFSEAAYGNPAAGGAGRAL